MIKYQLICCQGHEFQAWFRCSNTFDVQSAAHQIECPHCGSVEVLKSVMSPKVTRLRDVKRVEGDCQPSETHALEAEITEVLRSFRAEVESRSEYVGKNFAEKARGMHFDDKPKRDIWGEATVDEVRDLIDDEIEFGPLPRLPEDAN